MPDYRFIRVTINDQFTDKDYIRNGTGTAVGQDQNTISEFYCKCTTRPDVTGDGSGGRPKYVIAGNNPSGRHVEFEARCTSRGNDPFVGGSTVCTFKKF